MAKVWPVWILGACILLAAIQAVWVLFVTERFAGLVAAVVVLGVPILLVASPVALGQGIRELRTVRRHLDWRHILWLLIILSSFVFRNRTADDARDMPLDLWALYRVGLVGIVAGVLAIRLFANKPNWTKYLFRGLIGALTIYGSVCVLSTIWSVYPAWTLYKSLEFFVDLSLLAAIFSQTRRTEDFQSVFDWTWTLCIAIMAMVWLGTLLWPQDAIIRNVGLLGIQIQGIYPMISANSVGETGAFLGVFAFSRMQSKVPGRFSRNFYTLIFAASVVTLIFAQTRTALVGFLIGISLVLFFSKRFGVIALAAWALILLFMQTSAADVLWNFFRRGQDMANLKSLTGRVEWWEFGWQRFLERPAVGYGGYAGGRFAALAAMGDQTTSTIHNTYFEILLGTSVWGLIPVVVALVGTWRLLLRAIRQLPTKCLERQLAVEALGVLAVETNGSFFSSSLVWHPPIIFLLVLGYAEFLRQLLKHQKRAARQVYARSY